MSLKCIVIDDEQYAVDALVGYIAQMTDLSLFASYTSSLLALTEIKKEDQIDFIFLDIEMPEISGLDLAKSLRDKTKFLIFTTGHPSHALSAFDLNASQYLLKPITFSKFATTIDFILKDVANKPIPQDLGQQLKFIKANHKNAYHYIDATAIIYVGAAQNYSIIYTYGEQFITYMGLSQIETAIGTKDFIRVSKSALIAKNAIRKIEGNTITLKNDKSFQLGEVYKPAFKEFLNKSTLKA